MKDITKIRTRKITGYRYLGVPAHEHKEDQIDGVENFSK
jgi:hypothetical protein